MVFAWLNIGLKKLKEWNSLCFSVVHSLPVHIGWQSCNPAYVSHWDTACDTGLCKDLIPEYDWQVQMSGCSVTFGAQYDGSPLMCSSRTTFALCVGALTNPLVPTSGHCDICTPHIRTLGLKQTLNVTSIKCHQVLLVLFNVTFTHSQTIQQLQHNNYTCDATIYTLWGLF